jgi:hypothetical protein
LDLITTPLRIQLDPFPIHGIIAKYSEVRLIFPIVVSNKKKRIRTTCVLDTGSYLSAETFRDLGISDVPVEGCQSTIAAFADGLSQRKPLFEHQSLWPIFL